jgi:two-component system alkaline phosphatase synthesis response regulator PhoP
MQRTVLIIDDAAEVLALAQIFLKASGQWRVITALSGEAGLETAFREKPDVMLIDVRMPGIGGIATLERIRAEADWRPICAFLTASPEDLDPAMLERLSVPVIAKPFRAATFATLVGNLTPPPAPAT